MLRRNFRNQKNMLYVVRGARSLLWNLSALFYILSPSWKSLPSTLSSVVAFNSIVTKNHAYFSFNFFSYQRLLIFQIKYYVSYKKACDFFYTWRNKLPLMSLLCVYPIFYWHNYLQKNVFKSRGFKKKTKREVGHIGHIGRVI